MIDDNRLMQLAEKLADYNTLNVLLSKYLVEHEDSAGLILAVQAKLDILVKETIAAINERIRELSNIP